MHKLDEIDQLKDEIRELGRKQDKQLEALQDLHLAIAKQETIFEIHSRADESHYGQIFQINEKLGEYNSLLAVHIEGVNQLKHMNELLERKIEQEKELLLKQLELQSKRLEILEAPVKWLSQSKNYFIWAGKIAAAATAIAAIIKWIILKNV